MTAPKTPAEYYRQVGARLNWLEKLIDGATSFDERQNVTNLLLMEIWKDLSAGGLVPPLPPPFIPSIKEFPLTEERVEPGELIAVAGNAITAFTDGSLEGVVIRVDSQGADPILLAEVNPYPYPAGFSTLYLQNTAQAGKTLRLYIGTSGASASIELTSVTFTINVTAAEIMMPIDVQGAYIMMPVDIQAQYLILEIDIVAQTVGNIEVDLVAQTVGNIAIDIVAQSVETLNFNLQAQAVTLNMKFFDQAKGMMSAIDWATQEGDDIHLQGETAALAAAGEATLITLTLATNKEHWLYTVHVSGTQNGLGKALANKTAGHDKLAFGYFPANGGYIKDWLAPVKRRKDTDAGITEITVVVKNLGGSAGDFAATLDGLKIVDVTLGEKAYTSKADWDACASDDQIDTATSEGDVLLEIQP